ncbi:hypothetical protein [Pandoraea sp. B-6]|uniref:hypothetical protein n=1 Tax=Pandoraea sp. B-6 TaxID=1204340 RepID=UPI00037569E3|nr:hypothetical protein [Pandoraea sp. B-6]
MIVLRILTGAFLTLAIPFAVFAATCHFMKAWAFVLHPLVRIIRNISERHHLPGKVNRIAIGVAIFLSTPRMVVGQTVLALLSMWVMAHYLSETDVFNVLLQLTVLGLMPLAWLAIVLCGNRKVLRALECPFCVVIRWTLLLILVWVAHAHTAEDLALLFGPAASRLPVAAALGAFLRAVGYLAFPTAILIALCQGLSLLAFIAVSIKKIEVLGPRRFLAPAVSTVSLFLLTIWNSAEFVLISSPVERLLVAHVAFENDMLSEEACNGEKSARRVIQLDGDQLHAFAFLPQWADGEVRESITAIRKLRNNEVKALIPLYDGIVSCNWPAKGV